MTETTPPADDRPIRQIVDELLTTEARLEALGRRGAALRATLDARAAAIKAEQGVASTWRARGLGTISYSDPQPRVAVVDDKAFASWAAQRHPEQVTAALAMPAAILEQALELLEPINTPEHPIRAALSVAATWRQTFLEACAAVDDPPADVFAPETGEPVDGVRLQPAGTGRISARLDPEAKARAIAELADPVAAGIIAAPIGALVDPDRARQIREAGPNPRNLSRITDAIVDAFEAPRGPDGELLEADGEPDYEDAPVEDVAGVDLDELSMPELRAVAARRGVKPARSKTETVARIRATFATATA